MRSSDKRPRRRPKALHVRVSFGGLAATEMRRMLDFGLDGPTMPLVVEGLALAELRRRLREEPTPTCKRCGDDGNPCSMCGAGGQKMIPCDPITGDEL